ncbi:9381_t:CDS:2 [Rhizophagus irregularis]|nr:9381_t:CDS:2 [Rhizophagus irregularis]
MEEFRASFYDSGYGRMWTQYSWYIRSSMNANMHQYIDEDEDKKQLFNQTRRT